MKTLDEVIKALKCTDPAVDQETKCNDCPYKDLHNIDGLWYVGPSCLDEMFADALHYLKEYREKSHQLDIGIAENRRFFEQYGEEMQRIHEIEDEYHELKDWWAEEYVTNDPLTWDELKQMEGKPVFIKLLDHDIWEDPAHRVDSEWWIVGEVRKNDIIVATYLDEAELCEEDLGVTWNAYRKERE